MMTKEDWIKRCAARYVTVTKDEKYDFTVFAEAIYEDMQEFYHDDPEGAADEDISYWD